MSKRYNNWFVPIRFIVVFIAIILFFCLTVSFNASPRSEDIRAFIDVKGEETLTLRDWMQEKNLDAIKLLNKSNRRYGDGVSIQAGRLYCFFEGAGTDELFDTTFLDEATGTMGKVFELRDIAQEYGAYAYIRHEDIFEVVISRDPYMRTGGMEGTSVYYSGLPLDEISTQAVTDVSEFEDLGSGWFLDAGKKPWLHIDTGSTWFIIIVIIASVIVLELILSLFYKKHGCNATIIGKSSQYVGHRSRYQNYVDGTRRSIFDNYMVYTIRFMTDQHEQLEIHVPKQVYNQLNEQEYGYLEYKQLGKRRKYVHFKIRSD